MSKKNIAGPFKYDDDEDYVPTKKVKYTENEPVGLGLKKHTLDSDEEDDEIKEKTNRLYNTLRDEDIDGQEERTIEFEGETTITPFNMKEEMEDGHFDKDGYYHFKKNADQLKDAWLDNIDWIKVRRKEEVINKYGSDSEESVKSMEGDLPGDKLEREKNSLIAIYVELLPMLKEGETVAKALKRYGGNQKRLTTAERLKLKKAGNEPKNPTMEEFMKLTELANNVIETGNMDVYQETYEMINLKIQRSKSVPANTSPSMDMFSGPIAAESNGKSDEVVNSDKKDTFDKVQWEFRWKNDDSEKILGPFDTSKMIEWKQTNYFKDGVQVRKITEKDGPWYHSSRIEFELYE